MGQIVTALIAIFILALAFKIGIILIILAGLIFRTKETVGLLLLGWAIVGFAAQPLIGIAGVIALLCFCLYMKNKEKKAVQSQKVMTDLTDDTYQA